MDEVKESKTKKVLTIIIAILCVVAICLGVGIYLATKNTNPPQTADEEIELSDEQLLQLNFSKKSVEICNEVDSLLAAETIDLEKIKEIYMSAINESVSLGNYSIATSYIDAAAEKLTAANLGKDALDFLQAIDVSSFPELERYFHYERIIVLARQLSDEETETKYVPMLKELRSYYEESQKPEEGASTNDE
jgi:hypothetical protein